MCCADHWEAEVGPADAPSTHRCKSRAAAPDKGEFEEALTSLEMARTHYVKGEPQIVAARFRVLAMYQVLEVEIEAMRIELLGCNLAADGDSTTDDDPAAQVAKAIQMREADNAKLRRIVEAFARWRRMQDKDDDGVDNATLRARGSAKWDLEQAAWQALAEGEGRA